MKTCSICDAQLPDAAEFCPDCGKVTFVSRGMLCQLFPENQKLGAQCVLFLTEKLLWLPDQNLATRVALDSMITNSIRQAANQSVAQSERVIPLADIQEAVWPAPDVRIGIFKRKGARSIRITRRSTGRFVDVCFGREQDAQMVCGLLQRAL